MTIVTNKVNTQFTANIGQAVTGFNAISSVAGRVSGAISGITSMLNPLNLAIGGLTVGGAIAGITELGSAFELTRNTLAGTLGALGIAGGADPTERFRNGLGLAAATMERIEVAAAALPGEAEDYITVFRAGLPVLQASVGGTLADMTDFANRFTAIGRTFGVESQQLAMDLQRLLRAGRGGAGTDVRTFQQLLPFMRTVAGHADITADAFNRMTAPERVALLNQAFEGLGPMLEEAGGTWDSMSGAITSTIRSLTRQATSPLFDGIKNSLGRINELFMTGEGELTSFGQSVVDVGRNISRYIVQAVESAVAGIQAMRDAMQAFTESDMFRTLLEAATRLGGAVGRISRAPGGPAAGAAGAAGMAVGVAGLGAAAATGPGALVAALAGGIADFLTRTESVNLVLEQMVGMFNQLTTVVGPLVSLVGTSNDLFGDLIQGVLPGILSGLTMLLEPLTMLWSGIATITEEIMTNLNPVFESLFNAVGNLFQSIGTFLNPVLRILGRLFLMVYEVLAFLLTPVIEDAISEFAMLIDAISEFLSWLGGLIGELADVVDENLANVGVRDGEEESAPGMFDDILAALTESSESGDAMSAAENAAASTTTTPGARGGAHTTQDFRYSRFDITQRFAEGYDPDRIAIAFADDVGRMGAERLQSGLEPIFGVR